MIKLRDAEFSDYAAIAKLHAENWRQNYRGIFSDNFLDNEVEQERSGVWYNRLKFPDVSQQVTVAMLDEEVIGFSCLYINEDPVFGSYLDNLHVSGKFQRSGIGKLLLRQCAECILVKADSNMLYLWVYESNDNARKAYERLGAVNFETIETETIDGYKVRQCRYVWKDVFRLTK